MALHKKNIFCMFLLEVNWSSSFERQFDDIPQRICSVQFMCAMGWTNDLWKTNMGYDSKTTWWVQISILFIYVILVFFSWNYFFNFYLGCSHTKKMLHLLSSCQFWKLLRKELYSLFDWNTYLCWGFRGGKKCIMLMLMGFYFFFHFTLNKRMR